MFCTIYLLLTMAHKNQSTLPYWGLAPVIDSIWKDISGYPCFWPNKLQLALEELVNQLYVDRNWWRYNQCYVLTHLERPLVHDMSPTSSITSVSNQWKSMVLSSIDDTYFRGPLAKPIDPIGIPTWIGEVGGLNLQYSSTINCLNKSLIQ